ncbi:thioredoxin family protein [Nocardioides bruguierae]|uniref:Thioredoxin family protein n=1 Tax=Nocardioides bruguierae TaxID=2945102 RepID=A0A9X2DB54_9ACTN|nr:thioredoxin family protein [Nocardioides bruguierae]MCL8026241.1 thioredoxin family protein [Nocardioides bruguierae]MCM0622677.1 thioredoxin family protein [Nocardioides bruguierae]
MTSGVVIAVVAVVVAVAFGAYRAMTDGRFRGTRQIPQDAGAADSPVPAAASAVDEVPAEPANAWTHVLAAIPDAELGERATLVQFSSAFCAPCRTTRRVLGEVSEVVPGVVHLEVDAEQHLELVRELDVTRTPTTLILDSAGAESTRAAGAPRKETVLGVLADVVAD